MQSNTHYHLRWSVEGAIKTGPNVAEVTEMRINRPFTSREAAREAAPEEERYLTEECGYRLIVDSMSIRRCEKNCEAYE